MKVNLSGTLLWSQRYDEHTNNDEKPFMMAVDQYSNVYVTGIGGPFPGGSNLGKRQLVTVKYNAAGSLLWTAVKDTFTEYITGIGIALDSQNGLYILGTDWSILIHYLDQTTTGITEQQPSSSLQISPNPFIDKISIQLLNTNAPVIVSIYDVTGKLQYTVQLTDLKNELDLSALNTGIYFCKIKSNENLQTIKLIKN